jgi:hypothetical protein
MFAKLSVMIFITSGGAEGAIISTSRTSSKDLGNLTVVMIALSVEPSAA